MKKFNLVLYFSTLILLTSCGSSWQAYPDDIKYKMCDPYSGDPLQMLFIPGYGNSVVVVEDCDLFRRQKVAIALQAFEAEWIRFFGNEYSVIKNLRDLVITFGSERKIQMGYTADGRFTENGIIEGMTISRESIWVYAPPGSMRICETSLVHELVHASLWARNGHGDPDHVGNKFQGWTYKHYQLIDRVNQHLCIIGI